MTLCTLHFQSRHLLGCQCVARVWNYAELSVQQNLGEVCSTRDDYLVLINLLIRRGVHSVFFAQILPSYTFSKDRVATHWAKRQQLVGGICFRMRPIGVNVFDAVVPTIAATSVVHL
jgi:hypothetical protein